jgi:hypothetical protein
MIRAVAPSWIARAMISRTWTAASSTDPFHIASLAIRMFLALSKNVVVLTNQKSQLSADLLPCAQAAQEAGSNLHQQIAELDQSIADRG